MQKVKDFLQLISNNSAIDFYVLVAHIPQVGAKNYETGIRKIAEAKESFGPGIESPIGFHYSNGRALPQRKIEWEFKALDAAPYFEFIVQQQPIPAFELPLLEIIGNVYFYMIDEQGNTLPNQPHQSSLMVWLGRNPAICLTAWLPFAELSDAFVAYKARFADKFPGKFNEKYLRKVKPTKGGSSYQVRKI